MFNGQENLLTPSFITNMTKAHLKDGAIPHAIRFFSQSIERLGEVKQKREDYLVSLFDEVFGKEASEEMTYEKFRDRYIHAIQQTEQTIREARAYTSLREAVQEKDYLGIESLLKYYLVQSEERNLLLEIMEGDTAAAQELEGFPFEAVEQLAQDLNISEGQLQELEQIKNRKDALKELIKSVDLSKMLEIKELMGERQFKTVTGLKNVSPQDLMDMFNVHSQQEVADMLESAFGYYDVAAEHVTDNHSMQTMAQFHQQVEDFNETEQRMHDETITYDFGTDQYKRQRQGLSELSPQFDKARKQDKLTDELQELRAEEAKKNPLRNKGTEQEEARAFRNNQAIQEWQQEEEWLRQQGLTREMLQTLDQEELEWSLEKNEIQEKLPFIDLIPIPNGFNTELL